MEAVFFKLSAIIPYDVALARMKEEITKAYMHEGGDVVKRNIAAIDEAASAIVAVAVPAGWAAPTLRSLSLMAGSYQGWNHLWLLSCARSPGRAWLWRAARSLCRFSGLTDVCQWVPLHSRSAE